MFILIVLDFNNYLSEAEMRGKLKEKINLTDELTLN